MSLTPTDIHVWVVEGIVTEGRRDRPDYGEKVWRRIAWEPMTLHTANRRVQELRGHNARRTWRIANLVTGAIVFP